MREGDDLEGVRMAAPAQGPRGDLATGGPYAPGVTSTDRRSLLVLPAALVGGHLLAAGFGLATGARIWSPDLVTALICLTAPLAIAAGLCAARDGFRGHTTKVRPGLLVAQQVLAFVLLDALEHTISGGSPLAVVTDRSYWMSLFLHAAVGLVAWLALRSSGRIGRVLADRPAPSAMRVARSSPARPTPATVPQTVLALSSLSRRGPPQARLV